MHKYVEIILRKTSNHFVVIDVFNAMMKIEMWLMECRYVLLSTRHSNITGNSAKTKYAVMLYVTISTDIPKSNFRKRKMLEKRLN